MLIKYSLQFINRVCTYKATFLTTNHRRSHKITFYSTWGVIHLLIGMNHQGVFTVPINCTPTLMKALLHHQQNYSPDAASQKIKIKPSSKRELLTIRRDGHAAKRYKTGNKFPLPAATNFMPINKMNYSAAHFLCGLLFPSPRTINYVKV